MKGDRPGNSPPPYLPGTGAIEIDTVPENLSDPAEVLFYERSTFTSFPSADTCSPPGYDPAGLWRTDASRCF